MTTCETVLFENCEPNSVCFELIKGIPTMTTALIVGIIASYIAYRQWRTAHTKLKLDLFEKRYQLFLDVWNFLSRPSLANQLSGHDQVAYLNEFKKKIPIANFLFDDEIEQYMKKAIENLDKLNEIKIKNSTKNVSSAEDTANHEKLINWFDNQSRDGVKKIFYPFLNFKHLK